MSKIRGNIWGTHAIRAAWENPTRGITGIFVTEQTMRDLRDFKAPQGVSRPAPVVVQKKELDRMTGGGVHQGMALCTEALPEIFLGDVLIETATSAQGLILMLDQVTDPHNVGAILRSACAFGVKAVIMQKKHAPEMEGVLAKTACGALEHVQVVYETNLSRSIEALQDAHWTVIGMDERGEKTVGDIEKQQKNVLVLGAEGPGLRHNVREHCDVLARLEMRGPMPSINVSNAAAVALYALA